MSKNSSESKKSKHDEFAATQIVERADYSKEDRDIAFAVEVMSAAVINERQLASALANWTLHGSTLLSDHLLKKGLITQKTQIELEQRSECRLKELWDEAIENNENTINASTFTKAALERLDESGRIAKLLGISAAVSSVQNDELREHLSRYQLIHKIGQGGLGTVWLARDKELQRYVALKEIRTRKTTSKAALDRFRREAEITGRLEHPAIVPIYQLGEDATSGQIFYVMRFLGKQTLEDAIIEYHERREAGDDNPMLLRNLLAAFVTICQAIGHAHSRKVIHRDLKPENVAIDNFGQVIVIDWGLAKVLDDAMLNDSFSEDEFMEVIDGQRTLAGQVLGSPLYMAPEQAAGRLDEVNESTDIFGLGAILFAIITGHAPHEKTRESSGSATTRELITEIASGPTPHASTANEDADPILEAICAKAMAKRSYARYTSTTALAEDVQRWMAGETVSAYKERFSQRIGRWIQHHQRLSQLIAVGMIMLIVAGTTLTISARQNHLAAQQAQFEEMRSDEREVEVQLVSAAKELSVDVRFMSTLPPIQGIIEARVGMKESEGEEVWHGRLETIFEGLLRANTNYLTVAYIAIDTDKPQEIVRVERHASDQSYIRRVPKSRLATLELSPLFKSVMELAPGDVKLSLDEQLSVNHRKSKHRKILAAIPVFDEQSGNFFGLVAIEANIIGQIQNILNGLDNRLGEIYITDNEGKILVTSNSANGVEVISHEMAISELIPQTTGFFSKDSRKRYLSNGSTFIAYRVQLDPTDASCCLGIVEKIPSDD
ncbi:serine/threonine protein kinase [Gimesia aquarii]|uniref:Serine/threonine-protein kinase PknD n=1 Tax=Gimesia aquarii TaxID=2527964 RepID=A0A517WWP6_9PLAN|nr:protein kinase [Gimesia aquarii]QDU09695.1 Serine/threonine-protein kinase PknD [Gimesia aquarii]